jgi:Zn-dependent protease/CBS domain-containing protein
VLGVEIGLDYSWFILLFLILGSMAGGLFPAFAPEVSRVGHLVMGAVGAFLFFSSLLLHELGHAVTARARGVPVEGITLFIFGGMARTRAEPHTPGDEFLIAAMGPLVSFALAAGFYLLAAGGRFLEVGDAYTVTLGTLGYLNLLLAVFNLLPGFPLDGGRLLRAVLWQFTGSLRKATQIASGAGRVFGGLIIFVGLWSLVFASAFIPGLWLIFIGWFLIQAARQSYQSVLLQQLMSPLTAREAMSGTPETVGPDLAVSTLIHEHLLRRPYNAFPVQQDGALLGMVTLNHLLEVPRELWETRTVREVMTPREDLILVAPDTPMMAVLERMQRGAARRVLVSDRGDLVGIISASDVARWLDRTVLTEST